jgi:hypothetical protein
MNELQHRWLFQTFHDSPARAGLMEQIAALGETSRADYASLSARISEEADPCRTVFLMVRRNAAAQTVRDVDDVLAHLRDMGGVDDPRTHQGRTDGGRA